MQEPTDISLPFKTLLAWRPNTKVGHPTPNNRPEAGANSITQSNPASRLNSAPRRRRQIDISSFNSLLHQISDDSSSPNEPAHRNNPHTVPTPVDVAGLFRLVQDQFAILARDAPETANRQILISLIDSLNSDIFNPPKDVEGFSQNFHRRRRPRPLRLQVIRYHLSYISIFTRGQTSDVVFKLN